jgi:saccharopine dehydrogenase (NAD+, L-lysine-forming)
MSKVIVIGGCGAVGSVAVKTLAAHDEFAEVVIADINRERGEQLRSQIHSDKVSFVEVDALNPDSISKAIQGCDVVLNCSGPFYKFVKIVLKTVIHAGINYVDVCDDVDVTEEILQMDEEAKSAGISALIGMGSSPGVTNLLARFAADQLLDETESVDIYHTHGGEPIEGEGVIAHRFHCMSIDVPMFLDGELKYVKFFEPDGIALQEDVEFKMIGKTRVYPYPHPEQVTIPRHIKINRVTNKGSVLPEAYYELTKEMCQLGLSRRDPPLDVRGQKIVPYDFAIAYILEQREQILKEVGFGTQRGSVQVVVKGKKGGKRFTYKFHMSSEDQALGEGTGIPAALGAIVMNQGKIKTKGVFPPEGGVDPVGFLSLAQTVIQKQEGGKSFEGFVVEQIDEKGNITKIDI